MRRLVSLLYTRYPLGAIVMIVAMIVVMFGVMFAVQWQMVK
jgi:hypothetical protein